MFITGLLWAHLVLFGPLLMKAAFDGDISHFSLAIGAFGAVALLGANGLLGVNEGRDRRAC